MQKSKIVTALLHDVGSWFLSAVVLLYSTVPTCTRDPPPKEAKAFSMVMEREMTPSVLCVTGTYSGKTECLPTVLERQSIGIQQV